MGSSSTSVFGMMRDFNLAEQQREEVPEETDKAASVRDFPCVVLAHPLCSCAAWGLFMRLAPSFMPAPSLTPVAQPSSRAPSLFWTPRQPRTTIPFSPRPRRRPPVR